MPVLRFMGRVKLCRTFRMSDDFRLNPRSRKFQRLTDAAAAFEARDHHPGHGGFQNPLRLRQGIIERGAFFEFFFVQRCFVREQASCGTTFRAHRFNLKGDVCRPADG